MFGYLLLAELLCLFVNLHVWFITEISYIMC
jgi:hypothetical protein